MADETEETEGTAGTEKPPKTEKSLSARAEANLSRARKLAGQHFERDDQQSSFYLEYAEVQALLSVAEAIRENPLHKR